MSFLRVLGIGAILSPLLLGGGFVFWFVRQPLPFQDKHLLSNKTIQTIDAKEFMRLQRKVLGLPDVPLKPWTKEMRQIVPRIDRLDVEEPVNESEALQKDVCHDQSSEDCKWVPLN